MVPKGWNKKNLPEIAWFQEGPGLRKWQFTDSGYKAINITNIVNGYLDLSKTDRHISEEEVNKKYKHFLCDAGDIVVASSGNSYCKHGIVREKDLPLVMNTSVIRFKPLPGTDYEFLNQFLKSGYLKQQIDVLITGGAQPNFGPVHLKAVTLRVPPLPEQKKIAQILSTCDQAITATELQLENSQQRKKGMMQQLLTGKKRLPGFEGEWESSILTNHCSVVTGNKDLQNKVEGGEYPFFVRSDNVERIDSYSFDGEAILIPGDGRVGEIFHYIKGKFDFHQRVYKLGDFEGAQGLFIYYYLKRFFKAEVIKNSVKATVDSLRMPVFTGMRIKLPSREEQRQIVDVLSCSEKEVQAITQRLYLLKQEKKALMQQLLTGKRRVNVETEAA